MVEPRQQRVRREQLDARRRQLERQRQPLQPPTDRRDRDRVRIGEGELGAGGPAARHEEARGGGSGDIDRARLPGIGHSQRRQRELVLAGEAQRGPARHQDPQPGAVRQQIGDERRGLQQVLEVVQDEEDLPGTEMAHDRLDRPPLPTLLEPERLGDPPCDQRVLAQGGERDEHAAAGEGTAHLRRNLEGQAGLADAARPGEGQQPYVRAAQLLRNRRQVVLAAEQGRRRLRQRRRRGRGRGGGTRGWGGGGQQRRAVRLGQGQGARQQADGFGVRATTQAALQVAHAARAQARALGQVLLGQPGGAAIACEQVPEGWLVRRFHHSLLPCSCPGYHAVPDCVGDCVVPSWLAPRTERIVEAEKTPGGEPGEREQKGVPRWR